MWYHGDVAHDVFISYSSQDKAAADAVCGALEGVGIRCWIASRDVGRGKHWASAIVDAIDHTRAFILLFSSGSDHSPQVTREVSIAVSQEVSIIPSRIEPIEPSGDMAYYIGSIHWLGALTPPLEQHIERLVDTVQRLLQGDLSARPAPAHPAQPPATVGRPWARWAIAGVAGVAVITVVLLAATGTLRWGGRPLESATPDRDGGTREVAGVQPAAATAIASLVSTSQTTVTVVATVTPAVEDLSSRSMPIPSALARTTRRVDGSGLSGSRCLIPTTSMWRSSPSASSISA